MTLEQPMSTEKLRRTAHRAAALMRERARAASASPWIGEYRTVRSLGATARTIATEEAPVILQSPGRSREHLVPREEQGANAEHAGSWHPAVALAVADWLDTVANADVEVLIVQERAVLAVARAYLGGVE